MDYMNMINNKVNEIETEKANAMKVKQEELITAKKRFSKIAPEVKELLDIILAIRDKLPQYIHDEELSALKKCKSGGKWNHCIMSNGISHHFGLMRKVKALGWENGGFCGPWDVYGNGGTIWLRHEDRNVISEPSAEVINEYCDRFYEFKKLFEAWFTKNFGGDDNV